MLSNIEFEQAKADYTMENNKFATMEQELFQIVLEYKALLNGMNFIQ